MSISASSSSDDSGGYEEEEGGKRIVEASHDDEKSEIRLSNLKLECRGEGGASEEISALESPCFRFTSKRRRTFSHDLNLQSIPHFGRDDEIRLISDAYERVLADGPSEIVLIHGESGIGKSCLVTTAIRNFPRRVDQDEDDDDDDVDVDEEVDQEVKNRPQERLYVTAKYCQIATDEPYSAFYSCLTDLIDLLAQLPERHEVCQVVGRAFSFNDLKTLASLASNLGHLTGSNYYAEMEDPMEPIHASQSNGERFRGICVRFLKEVAKIVPIVMVIEDVHWADQESIRLLESLVTDLESRRILFVISYRDKEAQENYTSLRSLFQCFSATATAAPVTTTTTTTIFPTANLVSLPCTNLPLGCLPLQDVNQIVMHAINSADIVRTLPLSEVVLQKTLGNPFFVLQYLDRLRRDGLLVAINPPTTSLSLSRIRHIWDWDLARIIEESSISDNVLEVLRQKVETLPLPSQQILQIAACLGRSFELHLLIAVVFAGQSSQGDVVQSVVIDATQQGLLHLQGRGNNVAENFAFAHDEIQLSFYNSLLPEDQRSLMHLKIGRIFKSLNGVSIYNVVDQMNKGIQFVVDDNERIELARLNRQAGQASLLRSAVHSAAEYLFVTFSLMDEPQMWQKHYAMTLDLSSTAIEYQRSAGALARCELMYYRVVSSAASFLDTLRCRKALMEALVADQRRAPEALEVGLDTLAKLGSPVRGLTKASVGLELARAIATTRGKTDEYFLNKEPVSNVNRGVTMAFMSKTSIAAFFCEKKDLHSLLSLREFRWSVRHGYTEFTPVKFAAYASALCFVKRFDESFRFGQLALKLAQRGNHQDTLPWCIVVVFSFVNYLKRPTRIQLDFFISGYDMGLKTGNTLPGFYCGIGYLVTSAFVGRPLREIIQEAKAIRTQAEKYNQTTILRILRAIVTSLSKLAGLNEAEDDQDSNNVTTTEPISMRADNAFLLKVATFFQDWTKEDNAGSRTEVTALSPDCHFVHLEMSLFNGIRSFSLARSTGKRTFKADALKALHKLSSHAAVDCPDAVPLFRFLEAEHAVYVGRSPSTVREAYQSAVEACHEKGFVHYEAFALERLGQYLLELNDGENAWNCLDQATAKWREWQAIGKVDELVERQQAYRRTRDVSRPDDDSSWAT